MRLNTTRSTLLLLTLTTASPAFSANKVLNAELEIAAADGMGGGMGGMDF